MTRIPTHTPPRPRCALIRRIPKPGRANAVLFKPFSLQPPKPPFIGPHIQNKTQ